MEGGAAYAESLGVRFRVRIALDNRSEYRYPHYGRRTYRCSAIMQLADRLYSIPGPHPTVIVCEGQVTFEFVCTESRKEVHMDKTLNGEVRAVRHGLKKNQSILVLLLSLFHIGLAYIHTRDSGRTDLI